MGSVIGPNPQCENPKSNSQDLGGNKIKFLPLESLMELYHIPMNPRTAHSQGPSVQSIDTRELPTQEVVAKNKRTIFNIFQRLILNHWLGEHILNPYPNIIEKRELMESTGLSLDQICVWFSNQRVRLSLTAFGKSSSKATERKSKQKTFPLWDEIRPREVW
jgi:hypothetical protein